MVKGKRQMKPSCHTFDVEQYKDRLALLREIISGENQAEFAKRLGVPFKRWNTYERGYPIPRETAFMLIQQFEGVSVEWLWFGMTGNLSPEFKKKLDEVKLNREAEMAATKSLEAAQAKLDAVRLRRTSSGQHAAGARAGGSRGH